MFDSSFSPSKKAGLPSIVLLGVMMNIGQQALAQAPKPTPGNGLAQLGGRAITVPAASEWPAAIGSLSRALNVPIVAFTPQNAQQSVLPQPVAGDARMVLNQIARRAGGRWSWRQDTLSLSPSPLSDLFSNPARLQAAIHADASKERFAWAQFLASLNDEQVTALQNGRKIPVRSLKTEQTDFLQQVFLPAATAPPKYAQGEISLYVTPTAFVYQGGTDTYVIDLNREPKTTRPYEPFTELVEPQWDEIERLTSSIVGEKGQIEIKAPRQLTLSQLPELLNSSARNPLGGDFQIGDQVKNATITISQGSWNTSNLLAHIQQITGTELRKVGEIVLLAPSRIGKFLNDIPQPGSTAYGGILRLEADWKSISPIISRLYKSPLSKKLDFISVDLLSNPQLFAYESLTRAQQEWLIKEVLERPAGSAVPTPQQLQGKGIMVSFTPVIWATLTVGEERDTRGTTVPDSYLWAMLRSIAKLDEEGKS